jgi:hypothetical protein
MAWTDALGIGTAIIASLGGGGVVVFGLSDWLGKIWANRLMESERQAHAVELEKLTDALQRSTEKELKSLHVQLEIAKETIVKEHLDRVTIYRAAIDLLAGIRREDRDDSDSATWVVDSGRICRVRAPTVTRLRISRDARSTVCDGRARCSHGFDPGNGSRRETA